MTILIALNNNNTQFFANVSSSIYNNRRFSVETFRRNVSTIVDNFAEGEFQLRILYLDRIHCYSVVDHGVFPRQFDN